MMFMVKIDYDTFLSAFFKVADDCASEGHHFLL